MPLALLLFLVCAMLASVVLAAGTSAAGKSANQVDLERSYQSVTSAANLFSETLDGQEVELSVSRSFTRTTSRDYAGGSSSATESSPSYALEVDGKQVTGTGAGLTVLEQAVLDLCGITPSTSAADVWADGLEISRSPDAAELSVSHELNGPAGGFSSGDIEGVLEVSVMEELSEDGTATFTFSAPGGDGYEAVLTLESDSALSTSSSEGEPSYSATSRGRTETVRVTEKRVMTVSWRSRGVSKGGDAE